MKPKMTGYEKEPVAGKSEKQIKSLFGKITGGLMTIYVLFYLCVFPLCMNDRYFDVLTFRFRLFWKPTVFYAIVFALLGLLYLMCDALYNRGTIRKVCIGKIKACRKLKDISQALYINSVDVSFTVLILLFSVSTALAEYPYEAFWGNRGRCQGLLLWLVFYVAYFLITRFYRFKTWHIWAYMTFASIVCIWGICNFFLYTFGMFENADENFKYTFVSSIGNINTYTAFTGMLFGVAVSMFICSKDALSGIAAYVFVVIASFAHIMGLSDNAILSAGIVLAAAPFILWKNYGTIARYFISVTTYLGAMKITSLITQSGIKTMNDPEPSIQISIAGKGLFMVLLILFIALSLAVTLLAIKDGKKSAGLVTGTKTESKEGDISASSKVTISSRKMVKTCKTVWALMLAVGMVSVIMILILANHEVMPELWEPYKNILIFNDSWGTGRGLAWRLGMEYWRNDATLLMKLLGYGPDTYYIITMDRFMNIMQDAGYGMFDSAHNEYFEYFITVGIFGVLAYLSALYLSLKKMLSSGKNIPLAFAMGVIAYMAQASVNIAVPIISPVFMLLIFAGLASSK